MTGDLLERCLTVFTTGLHTADPLTLAHEAERVETMQPSPLAVRMRAAVDAERAERACIRCKNTPASALCCSSHNALLCHRCYRITHFVEICVEGCSDCAREGLNPAERAR